MRVAIATKNRQWLMGGVSVHFTYQVGLNGVILPNVIGQISWERGVSSLQRGKEKTLVHNNSKVIGGQAYSSVMSIRTNH